MSIAERIQREGKRVMCLSTLVSSKVINPAKHQRSIKDSKHNKPDMKTHRD